MVTPVDGYKEDFVLPGHRNGNHPSANLPLGELVNDGRRTREVSGMAKSSANLTPVALADDRPPWERQPAERINYYEWFQIYMMQDHFIRERSIKDAYRQACARFDKRLSTRTFSHCAKVWSWIRRAEAYDEHVAGAARHTYLKTVELMAARQARRAVLTASVGVAVIKAFSDRFAEKEESLTLGQLSKLLRPALDAIEMGQREERLALGFNRAVSQPETESEDLFSQALQQLEIESSPEVEEAFSQLEAVLTERTRTVTVKKTVPSGKRQTIEGRGRIVD